MYNSYNMKTIKYIGSKLKIIPFMEEIINSENLEIASAADAFSGSGRVTDFFIRKKYITYSNDVSIVSKLIIDIYLSGTDFSEMKPIIDSLNKIKKTKGFFTKNYGSECIDNSLNKDGLRSLWLSKNTMFLDSVREEIESMYLSKKINEIQKKYLIYLLILSMDKVDNTVGHQAGFLQNWAKRSFNDAKLEYVHVPIANSKSSSYKDDVFDFVRKINKKNVDLIYFDPPYGSNNNKMPSSRVRYGLYYNVWKTVVLNDKPSTWGKTRRREDANPETTYSVFEDYRKNKDGIWNAQIAIEKLIKLTNSKYIMFSYNNNGRVPIAEIEQFLKKEKFKHKIFKIDYKKHVMSNQVKTNEFIRENEEKNKEYIFLIWNKK